MKQIIIWIAILGTVGYFGSKLLLHNKVEKGVDNAVLAVAPFADIQYEGVSSTMSGELTIDGITLRVNGFDDDIHIARLGIDTPSYFSLLGLTDASDKIGSPADLVPDYFGVIAEGVRVRVDSDYMMWIHAARVEALNVSDLDSPAAACAGKYGYSPQALAGLGYDEQVASVAAHFQRGDGDYTISIRSDVVDMWDVDAELTLSGDMISDMARGARARPRMRELRIEYRDRSLNDRVRKYCERLGLDNEQILQAQLETLQYFGRQNGIVFDEYVIDPYLEFLNGKSTLVVTAKPNEPVSLSQITLYKPSDVPALLDLTAEAL